jgi:DNA-binding CsgD family transcriptional regulator
MPWRSAKGFGVLLDSMTIPALVVCRDGRVLHANCRAREFFSAAGDQQGRASLARLQPGDRWELIPLRSDHPEPHFLAILPIHPAPPPPLAQAIGLASDAWRLTSRQQAVLELLAQGRSNDAIAEELCIETGTVEFHVHRLLDKAGVGSRGALIAQLLAVAKR